MCFLLSVKNSVCYAWIWIHWKDTDSKMVLRNWTQLHRMFLNAFCWTLWCVFFFFSCETSDERCGVQGHLLTRNRLTFRAEIPPGLAGAAGIIRSQHMWRYRPGKILNPSAHTASVQTQGWAGALLQCLLTPCDQRAAGRAATVEGWAERGGSWDHKQGRLCGAPGLEGEWARTHAESRWGVMARYDGQQEPENNWERSS